MFHGSRRSPSILLVPMMALALSAVFFDRPAVAGSLLVTPWPAQLRNLPGDDGYSGRRRPTDVLEMVWPGYPEWAAMLAEILAGNQVSPDSGWFRKGVAHSRFGWKDVAAMFDGDRDGKVRRGEFPGTDLEFERLDVDRDGAITEFDVTLPFDDPKVPRISDQYSLAAFRSFDQDGNGKIDLIELDFMLNNARIFSSYGQIAGAISQDLQRHKNIDPRDLTTFLVLSDVQDTFDIVAKRGKLPPEPKGTSMVRPVPKSVLLRGFLRREIGSWGAGPAIDELAPDFTLATEPGGSELTLSKLCETAPVVLMFGNITCGEIRNHIGSLELLTTRYKGRAHIVLVYNRETHPDGGWQVDENKFGRVPMKQHGTYEDRAKAASLCRKLVGVDFPVLVDGMDDRVTDLYAGAPMRIYVIDRHRKVAYKSGRGPFGFKPAEAERSLILLLHGGPQGEGNRP